MGLTKTMDFPVPVVAPQPTVTPQGTPASKTWTYKLVAVKANGLKSAAGTAGSTSTGSAALNGTNFNRLTWTDPTVPFDHLEVWRTVDGAASTPTTTGLIGTVAPGVQQFDDTGLAGNNASAPSTDHSGEGDALPVLNFSDVAIQLAPFTGTAQLQGTMDGSNWVNEGSALTNTGVVFASHKWAQLRLLISSLTGAAPTAVAVMRQDGI